MAGEEEGRAQREYPHRRWENLYLSEVLPSTLRQKESMESEKARQAQQWATGWRRREEEPEKIDFVLLFESKCDGEKLIRMELGPKTLILNPRAIIDLI